MDEAEFNKLFNEDNPLCAGKADKCAMVEFFGHVSRFCCGARGECPTKAKMISEIRYIYEFTEDEDTIEQCVEEVQNSTLYRKEDSNQESEDKFFLGHRV